MNYGQWAQYGIKNGWATPPVCATHDGVPNSEEEEDAWEQGEDPCVHVIRLVESPEVLESIKRNNPNLRFE